MQPAGLTLAVTDNRGRPIGHLGAQVSQPQCAARGGAAGDTGVDNKRHRRSPDVGLLGRPRPAARHAGQDPSAIDQAARRVAEAASRRDHRRRAAERDRRRRTRRRATRPQALSADVLRHATRAAKRKARSRQRIRARDHPRRPARTLPPRDRRRPTSRTAPSTRSSLARPRARTTGAQTSRSPWTANRASSPHSRRPSLTSRRRAGARPGAGRSKRPAQLPRTHVRALGQPIGQVIAIRPGAGEIDDAAAHAHRPQVGRDPRRRLPAPRGHSQTPPTHTARRTAAPTPAPRRHHPARRSRAARASAH